MQQCKFQELIVDTWILLVDVEQMLDNEAMILKDSSIMLQLQAVG